MQSMKTPNHYPLTFLTTNFIVLFAENMLELIVINVKAGPLEKLTECIVNRREYISNGASWFLTGY